MKYILSIFLMLLSGWMTTVAANTGSSADTSGIMYAAPYKRAGTPALVRIHNMPEPETEADDALIESQLLNPSATQPVNRVDRKALFHFLRSDQLRKATLDKRMAYRLYGRLSRVFVRMKMYPLAMQYYFKTAVISGENTITEATAQDAAVLPFASETAGAVPGDFLSLNRPDTCYQNPDMVPADKKRINNNSLPVSNEEITTCFDDGKAAIAYAVIIHVKQPLPGKRKAFTGVNNVGHMFITLIKYNTDSGSVSRSFGFYPHKDYLLSATPLRPATSSVFKNDARHDWDESVGKFISEKRFKKMIRLIRHYENRIYHLDKNNCTDFGLYAADIAGILIDQSNGAWPFGSGNNPANAGQSILEGKFRNADNNTMEDLFVCTDGSDR